MCKQEARDIINYCKRDPSLPEGGLMSYYTVITIHFLWHLSLMEE